MRRNSNSTSDAHDSDNSLGANGDKSQNCSTIQTCSADDLVGLTGRNTGLARLSVRPSAPYGKNNSETKRSRKTKMAVSVPQARSNRCANCQFKGQRSRSPDVKKLLEADADLAKIFTYGSRYARLAI